MLKRIETYYPMEKGKKYLLFLRESNAKTFGILGIHQGKFNVDNLDTREKKAYDYDSIYKENSLDIKNKFKKEIRESLK